MSILNQHINLDMPAAQYHAVDALSKSMMIKILKSPAHYRAALEEHQEPTKSMQMGYCSLVVVICVQTIHGCTTSMCW
jgi:hypothetical protein